MKYTFLTYPRNIYLLSISQIIGMSAITIVGLVGGLVGAVIAPSPTLATVPATTMIIGVAVTTIPAALLMKKIGRKNGFLLSAIIASISALLTAYAVTQSNFFLLCVGTFLIGTNGAFVQQYRFAAIESVSKNLAGKAVSFLLLAGILAGVIGPEIAKRTKDMFSLPEFAGPFVVMAVLFGISALSLSLLKNTKLQKEEIHSKERPLKEIILQPHFFIAVLAAVTGYGVMTFIMTATPIHLHTVSHYSIDNTAFIIQSHVIAMFLPSLFTGTLIQKFGVFRVLLAGLASFVATVVVAVNAHAILPYWVALVLLGIGWNFLFVSATILLGKSYTHLERFKAQGVNDFIVVISQVLASFLAGTILFTGGWINLNLLTIPLIFITFIVFILNRKQLLRA